VSYNKDTGSGEFTFIYAQRPNEAQSGIEPTDHDFLTNLLNQRNNNSILQSGLMYVFGDVFGELVDMPNQIDLLRPVLIAVSDGKPHKMSDIYNAVATQLGISDEQRDEVYPSKEDKNIRIR
jgi:hypothetical protein